MFHPHVSTWDLLSAKNSSAENILKWAVKMDIFAHLSSVDVALLLC